MSFPFPFMTEVMKGNGKEITTKLCLVKSYGDCVVLKEQVGCFWSE